MNSKTKVWIILLLFVLSIIISFMFLTNNQYNYLIISGIISVILFVLLIISVGDASAGPVKLYKKKVKRIIKSYNPILIKSDNTPKVDGKCILRISEFNDLIDAQAEIRKPIYYVSSYDSTAFYLLDDTVCLVCIFKADEDVVSPLEVSLREQELKNNFDTLNLDKLTNIEKTLVLSYKDKSIKVSPVRDNKNESIVLKDEEPMIYQSFDEDDIKTVEDNNTI